MARRFARPGGARPADGGARAAAGKKGHVQASGPFAGFIEQGVARAKRAIAMCEEHNARGAVYFQKGIYDEACKEYEKAIALAPDYAEAYNNLGLCLHYMGRPQDALKNLSESVKHCPGWIVPKANSALVYQGMGQYEKAIALYRDVVRHMPNVPMLLAALGECLLHVRQAKEARECFDKALAIDPEYDEAHYQLGMLLARSGNDDEAESHLRKAVEKMSDLKDAYEQLGSIAAAKGNFGEAEEFYRRAGGPKGSADVAGGLAAIMSLEPSVRAIMDAKIRDLGGAPDVPECLMELGLAYVGEGNMEDAMKCFAQAAHRDPEWPDPKLWLGFCHSLRSDPNSAVEQWKRAASLKPDDGAIRELIGLTYCAMGRRDLAAAELAEAEKRNHRAERLRQMLQ